MRKVVAISAAVLISSVAAVVAVGWPTEEPPDLGADACGAVLTKPEGTPWECTLVEEFEGGDLDRDLWTPQRTDHTGYQHGGVCMVDDPENLEVSDGTLKIHTVKQQGPFVCQRPQGDYVAEYTSASVSTFGRFTQAFGRFEFRARFADVAVPGIHSALWMWPENDTKYGPRPRSGEIDVAEIYTLYPDRAVPMLHYDSPREGTRARPKSGRTNERCLLDPTQWTSYVAVWTEEGIVISYDGKICLDHRWNPNDPLKPPQPFDQPFMLLLTQVLGEGPNAVTPQTPHVATMEVDWVKVWR